MARSYLSFFISLPMLVSSIPCKNPISVLKIEDPGDRSDEMKELGGIFMLVAKISFYLICC